MNVLLVNDDGIDSPSLAALTHELQQNHSVTVVAPNSQRSAFSHATTIFQSVRVTKSGVAGARAYAISGTPADCTKIGLLQLCRHADIVLSGINLGFNIGSDIHYSGTVAAAMEGVLMGVPAIALSKAVLPGDDYAYECEFVTSLLERLDMDIFAHNILLNINFPTQKPAGVMLTTPAALEYGEYYEEISASDNEFEFKLRGELVRSHAEGTDAYAVENGYVSITPLGTDNTAHHIFALLEHKI